MDLRHVVEETGPLPPARVIHLLSQAGRLPRAGALRGALLACADAGRWTEADAARWWRDHAKGEAPRASPQ